MQKRVFFSALFLLIIVVACNKDKFQTKPTIELKSLSSNNIPQGGVLHIDLEYTDKEGDVQDTVFLKKVRLNTLLLPSIRLDTFNLAMPTEMPDKRKGQIRLILNENYLFGADNPGNPPLNDTIMFKIILKDKGNHTSDTVKTEPIVVQR